MPQISYFFGITITMYWSDHLPMHFHASYGEYSAKISIDDAAIVDGELPPRITGLVVEWTMLHRNELKENWLRCSKKESPLKIAPLL